MVLAVFLFVLAGIVVGSFRLAGFVNPLALALILSVFVVAGLIVFLAASFVPLGPW